MMETRETIARRVDSGEPVEFLFFWGHTPKGTDVDASCLSQWFPRAFSVDGVRYATAEHYMMAGKARLFGDEAALARVIAAPDPSEVKAVGRTVQGFDDARWREARSKVVVEGNVAKFGQHEDLARYLLSTGDRVLVEASPRDQIWGIGMGAGNPDARSPGRWRGLNLLGFALMEVRSALRARG
jgi:ribA/ribD-fused uncharacterized protein